MTQIGEPGGFSVTQWELTREWLRYTGGSSVARMLSGGER